jgi:transposase
MATMNEEIIRRLRLRSYTSKELAGLTDLSINTIREFLDRMERTGVTTKDKSFQHKRGTGTGRNPILHIINKDYRRNAPLIRAKVDGNITFRYLSEFLSFYGKTTKAHKAFTNFPILVAQLLQVGNQFDVAYRNGELDKTKLLKLNREIKAIQMQLTTDVNSADYLLKLMKQVLKNPNFWDAETLSNYFNHQTDREGFPIPPIDLPEILNILESEGARQQ